MDTLHTRVEKHAPVLPYGPRDAGIPMDLDEFEDAEFEDKFADLVECVKHHVEEEEGEMLPKADESEMDLEEYGDEMIQRKEELMQQMSKIPGSKGKPGGRKPKSGGRRRRSGRAA